MTSDFYHQQAPSVQVFEHSSNRYIDEAKERRSWNAFQKRATQSSHAGKYDLGVQSTLIIFAVYNWIQNKMPVQIQTSILESNQEEVRALAHHRPHVYAVDEHLLHHEQSIRAVGDQLLHCKPPVCAVGDHVLLESKKEQAQEPSYPTQ